MKSVVLFVRQKIVVGLSNSIRADDLTGILYSDDLLQMRQVVAIESHISRS